MKKLPFAIAACLLLASPVLAAQPVTINNAANTDSAGVTNHALNVNVTGGTGSTVTVAAGSHAQTAALAASLVVKASAGTLFSFTVSADTTLNAAVWYVMIFDAASLPADGAVTPAKCYAMPAGVSVAGGTFDAGGVAFATGIVIGVSTTGCFTKTASTHALFIGADYQ